MVPWRNLVVNTEKARTITAYFEKGKRRNNNLGGNAVEPLRGDLWSPSHNMLAYSMRYHLSSKCAVLPFFLNKDQALRKTPLYTAVIMKGTPRPTRCFQWGNTPLFMAWQRAFACWNPAVGPGSSQRRLRKVNPRRAALVWMGKTALTLFQRSNVTVTCPNV